MENIAKLTDEAVVKLVCNKDQELYAELVRRYQSKLRRYVAYLVFDKAKIDDIVQETLVKAFVNLRGFKTTKRFSSWIYRIAHNEAINAAKKRRREVSIEKNNLEVYLEGETDIESALAKKETTKLVNEGLKRLPVGYREPLSLYYLEEKSYEEISDILHLPTNTVGTRIRRGKERLKQLITNV